eukprot:10232123-Prorocentrum_lima.AAC.1
MQAHLKKVVGGGNKPAAPSPKPKPKPKAKSQPEEAAPAYGQYKGSKGKPKGDRGRSSSPWKGGKG